MELNFSKLDTISYRGFEGEKARAEKDALIEKGFIIVEGSKTPFEAPAPQDVEISTPSPGSPLKRKLEPFTGIDKRRNYRAMYRAACDFHERNNPPTVDIEYWKSHSPGIDETPQAELDYWEKAVADMTATANSLQQDPFLIGLLMAILEELELEYKAKKESCLS